MAGPRKAKQFNIGKPKRVKAGRVGRNKGIKKVKTITNVK